MLFRSARGGEQLREGRGDRAEALGAHERPEVVPGEAAEARALVRLGTGHLHQTDSRQGLLDVRADLAREVEDGQIENVFRLQVMNTVEERRSFRISASGLPGLKVVGDTEVEMEPASTRMVTIKLRAPGETAPGSHRVMFEINDTGNAHVAAHEKSVFVVRAP